jgi:hypothetical protein
MEAVLARYFIVTAKGEIKVELEAIADKMTKDQYVIFTKTKDLKYDKDLTGGADDILGLVGFNQADLYSIELVETVNKAKFAHLVTLIKTKFVPRTLEIDEAKAKKLFNKWRADTVWHLSAARKKEFLTQKFEWEWGRLGKIKNLDSWLRLTVDHQRPEERAKNIVGMGYNAIEQYSHRVIFLEPKAYKVEAVYSLGIPKEEKVALTPEEKEILEKYAPDLGDPTSFHAPMSTDQIKAEVHKMSDDDLAWHLLNSKQAMVLGDEDYVRDRLGFREICLLQLMNKNLSKKARTETADYMLDKMGVSFVGGPILKQYISALAKTGQVDTKIIKAVQDDADLDNIYYGRITDPDELRKFDHKKYAHQLAHNPHTPQDVIKKIVDYHKKSKGNDPWHGADVQWSGSNHMGGGIPGEDFSVSFSDALRHPNYPLDELLKVYKAYQEKYRNHPKAIHGMLDTLWKRPDLPKEMGEQLVKQMKPSPETPPACFDEQEFTAYWNGTVLAANLKLKKPKALYLPSGFVDHPHVPTKILRELLEAPGREHIKLAIYRKLKERGELSDKEVIGDVKKKLKFSGPDELLKEFGLQAYLGTKAKEPLKFTPVPANELAALKKEMDATTVHDDFTFEVVSAYRVDKQIHKDYPKVAKDLGNVKSGLYHGTSMASAAGILASGINAAAESRTGQMFGAGFYLASSASKAAQYASDNFSKSGLGVVFKMDVALGKSAEWKYGRPHHDDIARVPWQARQDFVKKDGGYLPRWHGAHDSVHAKKGLALQHDEYVVKSGQQINITEVIIVHKEKA